MLNTPLIVRSRRHSHYSPLSLFANSEQGAWYDPSDLSTLFQDAAGSTPVTTVGQAVRLMLDKSGRGNHVTAPSDAERPVLQQDSGGQFYLSFNGSSQCMSKVSVNLSATDKLSVFVGATKLSDAAQSLLVDYGNVLNPALGACFGIGAPILGTPIKYIDFRGATTGASPNNQLLAGIAYAAPVSFVACGTIDATAPLTVLRVNGGQVDSSSISIGTSNFGTRQLQIGSRTNRSSFFNGRLYGLLVRGATSTTQQIQATEAWLNARTRAY